MEEHVTYLFSGLHGENSHSRLNYSVSVEEYLSTAFRPECDYIDGEVVERNVGEFDHSRLQGLMTAYLVGREKLWGITTLSKRRVQVKPTRVRVPDIAVMRILRDPPLLCVEILSPDDRMVKVQAGVEDYLNFGVRCVWIVNPETRQGFVCTSESMVEARDGVLRAAGTEIAVPLADLG